ncbi:FYVE, RhoGEF and PH domain-containing protein 6-like [Acipenser ruthenus]|uniref:FYVE, RhoGEF and PH domain-containing protein 6-like n=1 Tax=Acipenser ruthenus TaxID=7906 RepID=UPI00145AF8EB|nr:FYVE, RhoGEF and PH domain-containing protein 6-like [Acipenser ruthenus]
MSADIKKPPVAPKPKFAVTQKPLPPPVAPKPDIVLSHSAPLQKKAKPVVAPKPRLPKSSSVPEVKPCPQKNNTNLEEKIDLSQNLGVLNSKNGLQKEVHAINSSYIIPTCTCSFDCSHKCNNTEQCNENEIFIGHLEKLEVWQNENIDGQQSPPLPRTRIKQDTGQEKALNKNQVVLKASFLEQKLKDVLVQAVSPNNYHVKQKSLEKSNTMNETSDTEQFSSTANFGDLAEKNPDESENGKVAISNVIQHQEGPGSADNTVLTTESRCELSKETRHPHDSSVPPAAPTKALPVPKPRKPRNPGLIRQNCIETFVDEKKEMTELLVNEPNRHAKCSQIKSPNVSIHAQSVLYTRKSNDSPELCELLPDTDSAPQPVEKPVTPDVLCNHFPSFKQDKASDSPLEISGNVEDEACKQSNTETECENTTPTGQNSNFIRCSTLTLSLPKHLKLSCDLQLSVANSPAVVELKNGDKKLPLKAERSPRVAPKKPQRHSLPAAGLLKKHLSAELNERSPSATVETSNPDFSDNLQGQPQEKPTWKLPHPIVPFLGNSESLKNGNAQNVPCTAPHISLGKTRAKSFSSADMTRSEISPKTGQKKNSLRKFLGMKLAVKMFDFPKFFTKGSQLLDSSTAVGNIPVEGNGADSELNPSSPGGDGKSKLVKALSAESHSPVSQKHGLKLKGQFEMQSSRLAKWDLVDEPEGPCLQTSEEGCSPTDSFTSQGSAVEYENLPHYEEIPEYMNLPFLHASGNRTPQSPAFGWQNSSSLEDSETSVYEVQEPYEPARSYITYRQKNRYRRPSQDENPDLEDVHSDEEEVINSSDEEDASSASSKGELDLLEGSQHDELGGKNTKVVHIAKEIMSSEKVFVDVLKLLHIDFRGAVAKASQQIGKPVIEDRILNQILYYLPQLYELNRDLLRELEERMAHWNDNQRIADIFVKKGPYLKMYSTYIKEFDKNVALLDEQCRKNPVFAGVVKEFEMSPRCASLALKHYLLKPVQRIPQYRLLLTDYLKNLIEDSTDYRDTQAALIVVIEVANHANDIMKQGDNFQKLMQIQYSLNGHPEIVQPGRVFLKEGTLMKLSRKVMQPRLFFLFNDGLLYTTPVQSGMYKLNNMLSLAGMKVSKPTQEAYQNELNIESVERSFILSASSATERDAWLEAISKAINDYTKKRITFSASKSEEADPVEVESDTPLGSKAPIWIPDPRATMCMVCTCEFTVTWRRHHCRACGKIVCQACSSNKHSLEYLKNQPARVCDHCFRELQKNDNQSSPKVVSPTSKSPSSALSSVLHSIPSGRKQKKIPAALKEVSASTEDSSMSGYLYRSKGNKKQWKHLWFVIKNKVLYTYAASEDVAALESQPLLGFSVKDERSDHNPQFQLYHKNTLFYIFKADEPHTAQRWLEAFQEATVL